ncbi:MarR family winged helix-turn-helix transcriptional regulator [Iodobacter ciconiae]|uniref:MarR family transcriptional regulator n=1 Tax=Iodobacter ciconiae TaxID=2496266 RepID=A0A3S8ZS53_9NEIS|nr:helix-turn-helix domain-containing protein [Iodobacter ciconiae]AZN36340.1 MarR family transcriptional regulator [Iodobacter ciconiae]
MTQADTLNADLESLFYGYRTFTSLPDEILAPLQLARVHHRILYFVARDQGLSVNTLLARLGTSKQALNRPLRELQAKGLVIASTARHDGRVKCLTLSESGQILEEQLSSCQRELLKRSFAQSPESEAGWRKIMSILATNQHTSGPTI